MIDRSRELLARAASVRARVAEIEADLGRPEVCEDPNRLRALGKERAELEPVATSAAEVEKLLATLGETSEIIATSSDRELLELARAEHEQAESELGVAVDLLGRALTPKDPHADRGVIIEIRAGTGGEEAALFAGDLFRMYSRYVEARGWKTELISTQESSAGGLKEVVFRVNGRGAFGLLKLESGVHRVQRVPATEASGRIHTSAATVAVLPEAEEVDVEIKPDEIRIDVFRSSGPGGQGVNTTDSAVRITHVPTGMVVTCQDERSQIKNRAKAMTVLRARLLDLRRREEESKLSEDRRSQVMHADRSHRIRTYNFPQGRVTDHRIGLTLYRLQDILEGDMTELIETLAEAAQQPVGGGAKPG